jgi:hypothetical protein
MSDGGIIGGVACGCGRLGSRWILHRIPNGGWDIVASCVICVRRACIPTDVRLSFPVTLVNVLDEALPIYKNVGLL